MKRRSFILATITTLPLVECSEINNEEITCLEKGFKVIAGEARFGVNYKMKGVTFNNLDIKISGKDTNRDLAVFEQTSLTPGGNVIKFRIDFLSKVGLQKGTRRRTIQFSFVITH